MQRDALGCLPETQSISKGLRPLKAHAWSSCRYRLGDTRCAWLDEDPCYVALGENKTQRQERYRDFLHAAIPEGEWGLIREAVQREQLTGRGTFVDKVERNTRKKD